MERVRLGGSNLSVASLAVGTAHFGDAGEGNWHIGAQQAQALVRASLDRGLFFFDTAAAYGGGLAEARLGQGLKALGVRRETVIATKVYFPTGPGPDDRGLSRGHLLKAVDGSLERLQTDWIDLLYIHRRDASTPIEETLATLDELARSGRVRHIGASSMSAWRLMKALSIQHASGFSPFIAMQGHFNLLYREEEREMLPLCREEGLGYLAWSPLACGLLAGDQQDLKRTATDRHLAAWRCEANDAPVLAALYSVAEAQGEPAAAIALAWLRQAGAIPVIGAASIEQLDVACHGVSIALDEDAVARLEAPYRPRPIAGFDPRSESLPSGLAHRAASR